MSRNGARLNQPAREAGVGLGASGQARRSSSLDGSVRVDPRRDGCGMRKARQHAKSTEGPPWLVSPADHERMRLLSPLIVANAGLTLNRWPSIHGIFLRPSP